MKFGLKDSDLSFLEKNLLHPLKQKGLRIFIFGSRVTGKNHPFSDIDLLLEGDIDESLDLQIAEIKEFFEESLFPYKLDLVKSENLASGYRDNVMRDRVEL